MDNRLITMQAIGELKVCREDFLCIEARIEWGNLAGAIKRAKKSADYLWKVIPKLERELEKERANE